MHISISVIACLSRHRTSSEGGEEGCIDKAKDSLTRGDGDAADEVDVTRFLDGREQLAGLFILAGPREP